MRLMDQARRAQLGQDFCSAPRHFWIIGGDAYIKSLALSDSGVERAHRFFERSVRIWTVAVEDVDVIQPHALERLIETGEHVFTRAPFPVRTGPHVVACFGG